MQKSSKLNFMQITQETKSSIIWLLVVGLNHFFLKE